MLCFLSIEYFKIMGKVRQVLGAVVDVEFAEGNLPSIRNQLICDNHGQRLSLEVRQHLGDNTVRCIAMESTDGLVRATEVEDTGSPITVPVGQCTAGRIFNVLGETIDGLGEIAADVEKMPIYASPPKLVEQSTEKKF